MTREQRAETRLRELSTGRGPWKWDCWQMADGWHGAIRFDDSDMVVVAAIQSRALTLEAFLAAAEHRTDGETS